jgi:beta-adrenergic-receptor kinase
VLYQQSKFTANRVSAAQKIFADYLMDSSKGNQYFMESRRSDIIRSYPGMRSRKTHNKDVIKQSSFNYPAAALSSSPTDNNNGVGDEGSNGTQNPIHEHRSAIESAGSSSSVNTHTTTATNASSTTASHSRSTSGVNLAVADIGVSPDLLDGNGNNNDNDDTNNDNGDVVAVPPIHPHVSSSKRSSSAAQSRASRRSSNTQNKQSLVAFGGMSTSSPFSENETTNNTVNEGDLDMPPILAVISGSVSNPSLSMDVLATKLAEGWQEYIVPIEQQSNAPNAIRLRGEPLTKIKQFFATLNGNSSLLANTPAQPQPAQQQSTNTDDSRGTDGAGNNSSSSSSSSSAVPTTTDKSFHQQLLSVFDDVENIIFYCLVDRHWSNFKQSPFWIKYWQFMSMLDMKVAESDFTLFRVLGRGGFGLVNGCKHCYSGKLFAMKTMNKKRVKMKKAEALCLNERNILAVVDSPYIVCLKYAFDSPLELQLILDLMIGGDLGYHLSQRKGGFTIPEAKYFASRILMGLAALHDLSIVYRDLKPENVLMDENGHTKLSDLGLACKVGRTGLSGTCGTRGYWAPEMLRRDAANKRERYGLAVDWFSFGCCVYEFIRGVGPFRIEKARQWGDFPKVEKADKDKAIDLAIQEMEPEFTSAFDDVVKDLICRLLNKNPKHRLGAKGYEEIMAHPWFAEIDFDQLNSITPPIKPNKDINMASQSDIGSFNDERESRKIVLTDADQKPYEKWQFISNRSFQEEVVGYLLYEELNVSVFCYFSPRILQVVYYVFVLVNFAGPYSDGGRRARVLLYYHVI